jgi:hypothetical protein
MDNVNLLLSGLLSGQFVFQPVCVPDCDTLKRELICQDEFIDQAYDAMVSEFPDLDGDGQPDGAPELTDELRDEICEELMTQTCAQ